MIQENRKNPAPDWSTRQDMVAHGMAISLPWFAFVNISFSLMIFFRNALFNDQTAPWLSEPDIVHAIDIAIMGIFLTGTLLAFIPRKQFRLIEGLLVVLSVLWSWCCYYFIGHWQLPFAYPLCAILLLSGLMALYFDTPCLLAFMLPLWLIVPVASIVLNQSVNLHFAVSWCLFSLILLIGRFILLRWFDEAWQQHQRNRTLISRLDALAHRDPLTGTANRRALENILSVAMEQQQPYALIMLDVDFFKRYNDVYGHPAGDTCLTRVAEVLMASVRRPEDVVARYGGEEFAIILFAARKPEAEQVAQRIKDGLQRAAIVHAESTVSDVVTVSQGIACSAKGKTAEQTIADADAALYRAKQAGRNRWSCSPLFH